MCQIKTTHYINRTKNPTWDVSVEFTVADFSKVINNIFTTLVPQYYEIVYGNSII